MNVNSVANWLGEKIEDRDGFIPKTMLSLPIFNGQRDVIGVAQLINKVTKVKLFIVSSCSYKYIIRKCKPR